jgi:hypothetical protein
VPSPGVLSDPQATRVKNKQMGVNEERMDTGSLSELALWWSREWLSPRPPRGR